MFIGACICAFLVSMIPRIGIAGLSQGYHILLLISLPGKDYIIIFQWHPIELRIKVNGLTITYRALKNLVLTLVSFLLPLLQLRLPACCSQNIPGLPPSQGLCLCHFSLPGSSSSKYLQGSSLTSQSPALLKLVQNHYLFSPKLCNSFLQSHCLHPCLSTV